MNSDKPEWLAKTKGAASSIVYCREYKDYQGWRDRELIVAVSKFLYHRNEQKFEVISRIPWSFLE